MPIIFKVSVWVSLFCVTLQIRLKPIDSSAPLKKHVQYRLRHDQHNIKNKPVCLLFITDYKAASHQQFERLVSGCYES